MKNLTIMTKASNYQEILVKIKALLEFEDDWVSAMATVVCELHHNLDYFHWTGFYRSVDENTLKIGPYQGSHGCLKIDFSRGVCGKAAREHKTQLIADVNTVKDHIACSASTVSEIVVPLISNGKTVAVLDVDSDLKAAFDNDDKEGLETICNYLTKKYFC